MSTKWLWSGAVTPTSASVTTHLDAPATSCRLAYSSAADLANPSYSTSAGPDTDGYVRFDLSGLTEGATWHYAVEIDGVLDAARGKFRTPSSVAAQTFTIGFASCGEKGDGSDTFNHPVYDRIVDRDPDLFIHLGDFHYLSTDGATAAQQQGAYDDVMALSRRKAFHAAMAVPYVWDDHDFGANDSDSTNPSADVVARVYRQVAPAYALPAEAADAADLAIYQTFQIGRIPFIITDLRYHRSPDSATDDGSKSMLGATQKAWFKAQLDAAKAAAAPFIVWCSSSVWTTTVGAPSIADTWTEFDTERRELAQYMADNGIPPVIILSGDAHQVSWSRGCLLAADLPRIPEYVSAAMSTTISASRNGAWTFGPVGGYGHYSTLRVTDDGTTASYRVDAFSVDADGTEVSLYAAQDGEPIPSRLAKIWDGSSWVPRTVRTWDGAAWVPHATHLTA